MRVFTGEVLMVRWVAIVGLVAGGWLAHAQTAVEIDEVTDLAAVGEEARARRVPVLLMFAARHCSYC
jgi:hypothetical protein